VGDFEMTDVRKVTEELNKEIKELKERYDDLRELAISNTLDIEALIGLLLEKGIITNNELRGKIEKMGKGESSMLKLPTWAGRSEFRYSGSVKEGVTIKYGNGFSNTQKITPQQFRNLLNSFRERTVNIGTSRTTPPSGSVGEWLQVNVTKIAMASYVGPILINENYASKVGGPKIKFK
jgi:hypothetical protein